MGRALSMSRFTSVGGRALVRRVLEQEAELSSCLCQGVSGTCGGRVAILRRAYRSSSSTVISLDRGARLVALLRPPLAAELVQPRRRRVLAHVGGRAVALQLVDAIEGDVQPVAALVLDHARPRWCSARRRSSPCRGRCRRRARGAPRSRRACSSDAVERAAAHVAPRAADAALAAEDLVVGEHAQPGRAVAARRDDESALEHADGERRGRRARWPRRRAAPRGARPGRRCRRE